MELQILQYDEEIENIENKITKLVKRKDDLQRQRKKLNDSYDFESKRRAAGKTTFDENNARDKWNKGQNLLFLYCDKITNLKM